MTQPTHSLSIDIGGTFTDFTLVDLESGDLRVHKVLTNADDPAQGLLDGVAELLEEAGASVSDLQVIVHSTTLATNSIIERKGANIALLTTEGFRDILEMGREQIYDMHDLHAQFPNPIVPRRLRREISERTSRDGDVFSAPQSGQTEAIVDELVG
ncbi:MAG: hydantoinase/oxoprolinase N-terminal domain-containing protein, partial [SAR202 cluster bacterium]|nr:hydantoinase/oxoprolinase N-terminal domain-containing protein [SAR202 cluster bacterium]